MSDIDDELLALAGGDVSSDEEEAPMDLSREESRSPSLPPTPAKKETPSRGSAAKKPVPKKTAKKRDQSHDQSEDEGEASSAPGSPDSQQSAPMDESDSDSDSPQTKARGGDDEINQYPIDGLFKSYDEKEQIMGMREIEREQILAERREENERIRQNRMLRQLKVNQDKDNKKRKASAADLEEHQRKTSRVRTKAGETSEKMDTLRRAREERSSRKEQRERDNDRRKQRSLSYRRSASLADGDSDVEWAGPHKSKPKSRSPERESPPAELRDLERVRVGRSRFAEVCFYPGFEDAITGCFVRINIGPDPSTRQDVYRMAIIKGFNQGRPYAMPDQSGHQMVVDTYVKAAHGKAQREWPFISCSDREFTEAEWNRYKQVCISEGVPVPIRPALVNKIDDINKLVKRSWTEQELSEKLKRQNDLRVKFSGAERDHLTRQLESARARGDEEATARLQEKLDNLETPRLAFKTSLNPQKKKPEKTELSQQEKLALINAENRRRNAEAVRKAQLKERARARDIEKRLERGEAVDEDHSRRLKTQIKFHHTRAGEDGKQKDGATPTAGAGSGTSTPANGLGTPKTGADKKPLLPHIAKLQEQQRSQAKNGIPVIHQPLMDDDIIGALDLDIDIDIS
ncbi:hypothetical protein B0T22DRAFT_530569 [Podospora appendiculata]|uniref:Plus3 domain-containing protein n=1 Tax=Podospora appendiculata TaxID=314037 RepID=A0AAE1C7R8_9PEZI|nr:hypothetical protein B0T22DRAFT_530569 [Podospora appendiculata]